MSLRLRPANIRVTIVPPVDQLSSVLMSKTEMLNAQQPERCAVSSARKGKTGFPPVVLQDPQVMALVA